MSSFVPRLATAPDKGLILGTAAPCERDRRAREVRSSGVMLPVSPSIDYNWVTLDLSLGKNTVLY